MGIDLKRTDFELSRILRLNPADKCFSIIGQLWLHHPDTYLHSIRVAALCAELFAQFEILHMQHERLLRSAVLHDIGKLRIHSMLLDKKGLSENDWVLMKGHCRFGMDLLNGWAMEAAVDPGLILYHHENVDGSGYYGKERQTLSLGVRILRVADSYDAMMYPRSYRKAKSALEAYDDFIRLRGVHYDAEVVDALVKLKFRNLMEVL